MHVSGAKPAAQLPKIPHRHKYSKSTAVDREWVVSSIPAAACGCYCLNSVCESSRQKCGPGDTFCSKNYHRSSLEQFAQCLYFCQSLCGQILSTSHETLQVCRRDVNGGRWKKGTVRARGVEVRGFGPWPRQAGESALRSGR